MAIVYSKIFKHHKKADGTYNVKICVYHEKKRAYIDTVHYLTERKLTSIFTIKDSVVSRLVNQTLEEYRETISLIGNRLDFINVFELREFLLKKDEAIDFIAFCHQHIKYLKSNRQGKSAANYKTVRYSLIDYFKRDKVGIGEITVNAIRGYENFLRNERIIIRINQIGKSVTIRSKRLPENSVHNYLRDFRGLFTAALNYYNNSQFGIIRIKHNPFENFKIAEPKVTAKRNIDINVVKKIRDCKVPPDGTAELARDLFMLSFYMCGINAADLQACEYKIVNDRLEYNRSKTKGKRKDSAFISIKIISEAKPLLLKYQNLCRRYSNVENLNSALSWRF